MKKTRKVFAVLLAVIMLFGVMSVTTYARDDDPVITVYFTCGNFTTGGYNFTTDRPIDSVYNGSTYVPAGTTSFSSDLFGVEISLSEVNTSATRQVYGAPSTIPADVNALDVITQVLLDNDRTPYGGWDSYNQPAGGYITGFGDDGSTDYYGYTEYPYNGHMYYHYTGTNWQIAYNTVEDGPLAASTTYGTSITDLFDGMIIVFDLSAYDMYYKIY